jgi:hypothetical protein
MKIGPVGAELFSADRQTDIIKLIVIFRNFVRNRVEIGEIVQMETYDKHRLYFF